MDRTCPRCHADCRAVARFCGRCGLAIMPQADAPALVAGRHRDPHGVTAPSGFTRVEGSADLHYRAESAWGGARMLGTTEGIAILLFNGGYPLVNLTVRVEGFDEQNRGLFAVVQSVEETPRGMETKFEVPSYELPVPVHHVRVVLVSAEFGPER